MSGFRDSVTLNDFHENYTMLVDYPPNDLMREIVYDANVILNYVLKHVINQDGMAVELPRMMESTLTYIVNFRAANFNSQQGGVIDAKTMIDIRRDVNKLVVEYLRLLADKPFWFNHHIRLEHATFANFGGINPVLVVGLQFTEEKMGHHLTHMLSQNISPQILQAVEMMVMRYEPF